VDYFLNLKLKKISEFGFGSAWTLSKYFNMQITVNERGVLQSNI